MNFLKQSHAILKLHYLTIFQSTESRFDISFRLFCLRKVQKHQNTLSFIFFFLELLEKMLGTSKKSEKNEKMACHKN